MSQQLSFDGIDQALTPHLQADEADLKNLIDNLGDNPSTGDLLKMQVAMQRFTMRADLFGTLNKTFAECCKGIIQKSG